VKVEVKIRKSLMRDLKW